MTKAVTKPEPANNDGDSEDDCWWYAKVRDTRSTCPPSNADADADSVTFDLVRDKGGEWLKQLAWPFDRPLRVCVAVLQKECGSALWDVCLKHKGKLVNSNDSPEEAGISQGDTVRLALLEPWAPAPIQTGSGHSEGRT